MYMLYIKELLLLDSIHFSNLHFQRGLYYRRIFSTLQADEVLVQILFLDDFLPLGMGGFHRRIDVMTTNPMYTGAKQCSPVKCQSFWLSPQQGAKLTDSSYDDTKQACRSAHQGKYLFIPNITFIPERFGL